MSDHGHGGGGGDHGGGGGGGGGGSGGFLDIKFTDGHGFIVLAIGFCIGLISLCTGWSPDPVRHVPSGGVDGSGNVFNRLPPGELELTLVPEQVETVKLGQFPDDALMTVADFILHEGEEPQRPISPLVEVRQAGTSRWGTPSGWWSVVGWRQFQVRRRPLLRGETDVSAGGTYKVLIQVLVPDSVDDEEKGAAWLK